MVHFVIKNSSLEAVSQLSNIPMAAYLECGQCGKHSEIDASGQCKCPHCGSTHVGRMEMGGGKPSWFKEAA